MSGIWAHYTEILTDPAHSLVEFTFVLLDYLVIGWVAKRLKAHFHRDLAREHVPEEVQRLLDSANASVLRAEASVKVATQVVQRIREMREQEEYR